MKKFYAIVAVILAAQLIGAMLLTSDAQACEEDKPMTTKSGNPYIYNDASWWPVTESCQIPGIKDPDEPLSCLGVQHTSCQWVAGKLPSGWAKTNEAILTVDTECTVVGLTKLSNVTIELFPVYADTAQVVIWGLLGEDTEISAEAIVACSIWWRGDYASVIFHPSYSDRFQIGWVSFNGGEDVTPLMLGHFAGEWHFGLKTSDEIAPEVLAAQAEAEARAQAEAQAKADAEAKAQASAQASVSVNSSGNGDGCYRNNTVIQINLLSIVKNCIKFVKECTE